MLVGELEFGADVVRRGREASATAAGRHCQCCKIQGERVNTRTVHCGADQVDIGLSVLRVTDLDDPDEIQIEFNNLAAEAVAARNSILRGAYENF